MHYRLDRVFSWIVITISVVIIAGLIFFITYSWDYSTNKPVYEYFYNLFAGDPVTFLYSLTAAAQCLAATLGIMIALVLVIVQLTANRYTPKVVDIFITHWANIFIISIFIISIIYTLWIAHSITASFVPRYSSLIAMSLVTICYSLILPYFLYLFNILKPINIINQIRDEAIMAVRRVHKDPSYDQKAKTIIINRMEQIADISLSSVQVMDSEITHHSIWALQSIINHYLMDKEAFHKSWYQVDEKHLLGLPRHIIEEMVKRESWVEFRVFRQFRVIFATAIGKMFDVNSAIAQAFRAFGIRSIEKNDIAVLELVIKYFNSLIRSSISMNDGRSAIDTLYQYRLLAERIIETHPDIAKKVVKYLNYYALIFVESGIRHTFETVAYDLRKINERAFKKQVAERGEYLEDFLRLQYKLDYNKNSKALRGLWRTYCTLASFFLIMKDEEAARTIYNELKRVPLEVLLELKMEILSVTEAHYWEINDRIINYDYIPPEQKERLNTFFDWFIKDIGSKEIL